MSVDPADTERRTGEIRRRIEHALAPSRLEVIDESHLHVGHAGARDGRGHFRVHIESDQFTGLPRLARHRLVYRAIGDLMSSDIHALTIEAVSRNET